MALTKKKKPTVTPKLPNINALKQVNSNAAGSFYNDLLTAKHKIEYASKDIALSNIRTNPDNEIFRELDDDDDIRILADDIKRNGFTILWCFQPRKREERSGFSFPVSAVSVLLNCWKGRGTPLGAWFATAM